MSHRTVFPKHSSSRLAQDWKHKNLFQDRYSAYRDESISMLTDFQSMREEQLGPMTVVKHRIELADEKTQPFARLLTVVEQRAKHLRNSRLKTESTKNNKIRTNGMGSTNCFCTENRPDIML